jgi:hypothetical protein
MFYCYDRHVIGAALVVISLFNIIINLLGFRNEFIFIIGVALYYITPAEYAIFMRHLSESLSRYSTNLNDKFTPNTMPAYNSYMSNQFAPGPFSPKTPTSAYAPEMPLDAFREFLSTGVYHSGPSGAQSPMPADAAPAIPVTSVTSDLTSTSSVKSDSTSVDPSVSSSPSTHTSTDDSERDKSVKKIIRDVQRVDSHPTLAQLLGLPSLSQESKDTLQHLVDVTGLDNDENCDVLNQWMCKDAIKYTDADIDATQAQDYSYITTPDGKTRVIRTPLVDQTPHVGDVYPARYKQCRDQCKCGFPHDHFHPGDYEDHMADLDEQMLAAVMTNDVSKLSSRTEDSPPPPSDD